MSDERDPVSDNRKASELHAGWEWSKPDTPPASCRYCGNWDRTAWRRIWAAWQCVKCGATARRWPS